MSRSGRTRSALSPFSSLSPPPTDLGRARSFLADNSLSFDERPSVIEERKKDVKCHRAAIFERQDNTSLESSLARSLFKTDSSNESQRDRLNGQLFVETKRTNHRANEGSMN